MRLNVPSPTHCPHTKSTSPRGAQGAISNPGWPPLNGSHIQGSSNPAANWFATFGIVYTPSSGIWQTVWLEAVPNTYIQSVAINQASHSTVTVNVSATAGATHCAVIVFDNGTEVASAACRVGTAVSIPIPSAALWSPDNPHLYDLKISLTDGQAETESGTAATARKGDEVLSYFGLRTFELAPNALIPETALMRDTDLGPPPGCKCLPCPLLSISLFVLPFT